MKSETVTYGGGGTSHSSTNDEITPINSPPNAQPNNENFVLSETGAVEAIASAVPSDSIDALKVRLFSTSVTSTRQALASTIVIFLYNMCI